MAASTEEKTQQRRANIIEALILTAIVTTFGFVFNTDRNVSALRAKMEAADALEMRDPSIRERQYKSEMAGVKDHINAIDGRVRRLEGAKP